MLKQCFTDSFGDDFIVLDIDTYVSSVMKEIVAPQQQSFVHMGWGADFGDPVNFLAQVVLHDDNAYYSCNLTNIAAVAENPADYQKDVVAAFEQFTQIWSTRPSRSSTTTTPATPPLPRPRRSSSKRT